MLEEVDALVAEYTAAYRVEIPIRSENGVTAIRSRVVPGLLDQLAAVTEPAGHGPAVGGWVFGSRPAARLSAVNLLDEIRRRLAVWSGYYTGHPYTDPAAALRELQAVAAAFDRPTISVLVAELENWRTRARWILGWDTPPLAPHVPCPQCAAVALRLWAVERQVSCVSCGAWWDTANLVDLRDRLRLTGELRHAA